LDGTIFLLNLRIQRSSDSTINFKNKYKDFKNKIKNEELYSRILKANLSWNPTWAKFCQLIANISMVLHPNLI